MRAAFLAALTAVALSAAAGRAETFRFVAVGDMPYNLPADHGRFEALVDRINALRPAFTVHVGDTKNSATPCSDAVFARIKAHFDRIEGALVYTPGDNEWTDCHYDLAGRFNAVERLARLRDMFFPKGRSLGQAPIALDQQSVLPGFAPFVENAMWTHGGVQFAAIHVVGSANNLQRGRESVKEYLARNAAGLAWLDRAFDRAEMSLSPGLVIFIHANPLFDQPRRYRAGFNDFLNRLTERTIAYGRPVLLVHGDTHYFRFDQPLSVREDGRRKHVDHFFRLEVFGASDMHGVEVVVDTESAGLFAVRPVIVEGNRSYSPRPR